MGGSIGQIQTSLENHTLLNTGTREVIDPRSLRPAVGLWGEWLFIFRELGSTGNYFRGAREQANNFGDIGSLAKKAKK